MKSGKKLFKLSRSQWISVAVMASSLGLAAAVTLPFPSFTAGTPAKASEVQGNFTTLANAVTALESAATGFDEQTVDTIVSLTTTTVDLATFTIVAPTNGFVIVTGNGAFQLNHVTAAQTFARVFLSTGSLVTDFANLTFMQVPAAAPTGTYGNAFSITRVFPVTAGTNSFFMTANMAGGLGQTTRHNLTGIFIATRL